MLCLLKMGPYLRERVKCLSINLRSSLPKCLIVLRGKMEKSNCISAVLPSAIVRFRHVGDAVHKPAGS